jgi:HlyD family secretion protein
MRRGLWILVWIGVFVIAAGVAGFLYVRAQQQSAQPTVEVGEVTQITAVTSVESTGAVAAQQSGSVSWTTVGLINMVAVKVGDQVKKGDVLMTLEPATVPQNIIMAQADLINAQKALDDLLHPSELSIANAQKAVVDAEEALKKAQQDLKSVENPAGQSVFDAVNDAKLALETAQTNLQLTNNSADVKAYNNAVVAADAAFRRYQDIKAKYDESNNKTELQNAMNQAEAAYQNALADQNQLALKIQNDNANKEDAVKKAQDKYDQAVRNLNAAQAGPDPLKLSQAQAKVAVAEATLADAKDKLDKLQNGADPKDIAAAQARVLAAQSTVASAAAFAPFDGEIVTVNYQVGDTVQNGLPAVTLVNRAKLHVDVSVDESDVSLIALGDPVTVTFDSLPGLTLQGTVAQVNPVGSTVQGLVRYTVRVDLAELDPRVLIGMTASVNIVTDTNEGALAVPLDAVQLDQAGEFVTRVKADGTTERVEVVSGEVQGELVVVEGALTPGDQVQIVKPVPTNNGSPFG